MPILNPYPIPPFLVVRFDGIVIIRLNLPRRIIKSKRNIQFIHSHRQNSLHRRLHLHLARLRSNAHNYALPLHQQRKP